MLAPLATSTSSGAPFDIPLYNELHARVRVRDPLGLYPDGHTFAIWDDPVKITWPDAVRRRIEEAREHGHVQHADLLLGEMPPGDHLRPLTLDEGKGERAFYGIWTYDTAVFPGSGPVYPPPIDPFYGQAVLRGLVHMVPALAAYLDEERFKVDDLITVTGGYYCKTPENMPLLGPLRDIEGLFVCGALSGFGVMSR